MPKYYIDTCIWMDVLEDNQNSKNKINSSLFFNKILRANNTIIVSDVLIHELQKFYSTDQIKDIFIIYEHLIEHIRTTLNEEKLARGLANERNLPLGDVLHTLLARKSNSILVTRDKDFQKLNDIYPHSKPENSM